MITTSVIIRILFVLGIGLWFATSTKETIKNKNK